MVYHRSHVDHVANTCAVVCQLERLLVFVVLEIVDKATLHALHLGRQLVQLIHTLRRQMVFDLNVLCDRHSSGVGVKNDVVFKVHRRQPQIDVAHILREV